jgi:hypothetical protein
LDEYEQKDAGTSKKKKKKKHKATYRLKLRYFDRRLRQHDKEKIGQTFWRIHYHETVVWELKALCNQKDIFVAEAEMEEMLASPTDNPTEDWIRNNCMSKDVSQLPSVVHSLNSTTSHSSTILDTGAMMHMQWRCYKEWQRS